ncbi:hypothetical protein SKUN_00863 [Spiroplasma kunkelii CR2-3x]|uniref:Uncharacterized protein n=1 Tax=Spiroplasma kunkelii CR2-3x TaxID=273035 RepID=A0A0K2JH59_SPIKU|nr:hypothetical protein SKUN_00863 [Spiroplasma kunkelii CR2-3x]
MEKNGNGGWGTYYFKMVYSKIIREACLKVELKQTTPQYIKEMIKKDETSYTEPAKKFTFINNTSLKTLSI